MREEKKLFLQDFSSRINRSAGFILIRYSSLSPNGTAEFRKQLAMRGDEIEVVKRRIFKLALPVEDLNTVASSWHGNLAVVFSAQDTLQTVKSIYEFHKTSETSGIEVLGGVLGKEICSASDLDAYSKLPDINTLRAQFLSVLDAPAGQLLGTFNAILTAPLSCMRQRAEKMESEVC